MLIVGDFNCDYAQRVGNIVPSTFGSKLQSSLLQFNYSVINDQPTRVTGDSSTLIDLVIASKCGLVKNTKTLELGISDHMLVHACMRTKVRRDPPKIVKARSFKRFNREMFMKDIESAPWSVCLSFDDPDDCYWAWQHIFNDICNKHAQYREIKLRRQSLPWITPQIRHKMNLRFKTLGRAKESNEPDLWAKYRKLRNQITQEVRAAKCSYFSDLFNEVKDCKSYWKLIKTATCEPAKRKPIVGIRREDGSLETSDQGKANILNDFFSSVGEELASDLPSFDPATSASHISRVTPSIMNIDLNDTKIALGLKNLKPNKSCGPDNVAPKLLKLAGDAIVPSLRCVYHASVCNNSVPAMWKSANVSCLHKKDDETDKSTYRPISLLCVPGKLMESCVVSTITSHIADHGLSNKHQWAYKQGHSTELLLAKMSEDWRRALHNNHTVGIVFVDFRKAFDSISHPLLLKKLQGLGIAGDLWSWIRSYLSERSQLTV